MPLLDLPLDKLRTYEGRNPRPADFDEFWDRTLREMAAIDPDVAIEPSGFDSPVATCSHLRFTGLGGARVHAKLLVPKTVGPHRGLLHFHGYTMRSGDWTEYLGRAASGFVVAALDCRGQGGLSEDTVPVKGPTQSGHIIRGLADGPDALYYRHVFADTARLAHLVMAMPEVDANRVVAHGGSQGGALTVACAGLVPEIRRIAPVYPFLSDYLRVWEMDLAQHAYGELKTFFKHHDPRHLREDEWFERLGYIDVQHLAPRVRAESLYGIGLMDNVCPPSTIYASYNKLPGPKRELIYPDFGHEGLPGFEDEAYRFLLQA